MPGILKNHDEPHSGTIRKRKIRGDAVDVKSTFTAIPTGGSAHAGALPEKLYV